MAKVRIYELARELGVENKIVLSKAQELGIPGKTSHSNSLDSDEADKIRRTIIREAIGVAPESEVVKTSVDSVTGEQKTIVESRKGNVIRRRRRKATEKKELEVSAEAQELEAAEAALESETEQEQAADAQPEVAEPVASEDVAAEEAEVTELMAGAEEAEEKPEEEAEKKGPKVLGKIELTQRTRPKKPAKPAQQQKWVATPDQSEEDDEDDDSKGRGKKGKKRKSRKKLLTRGDLLDYEGHRARKATRGGKRKKDDAREDQIGATELTVPKASKRVVKMDEAITVGDLAQQMSLKAGQVIQKLIELGVMATINQVIDFDTATIVASEFEYTVESTSFDEEVVLDVTDDSDTDLSERPPVVTVMGHVDHGKTSLLDKIRDSSVAAREHGGITQHIGAYNVELKSGKKISFIDTPGHAAFTAMRARGAKVTDIVVIVVAADDGVMPQTVEAINHAKAADVGIIVAVNKMDVPNANPDKAKQQLAERGLQPEEWGGDVMFYHVSALTGQGIEELLEGILLLAEVRELRANSERRAVGTIIEARQDVGRGTVATVLVQNGTLRVGDVFVCGTEFGRVRSMTNYLGDKVEEAPPSLPVEISGLNGTPSAGDDFVVVENEAKARQVASNRQENQKRKEQLKASAPMTLEEFSKRAAMSAAPELNVIVKADVDGSLEAVRQALEKLESEQVMVKVIHTGVGGVNESDIKLAIASSAIVVGFNVRGEPRALADAESSGVDVRFYRVIYELVDDIKAAMAGLLAPIQKEVSLGRVEVRDTFSVPKIGTVAGCYVQDGIVRRGAMLRLLRDSIVVHEGQMANLRRFKDDVKEVQTGYECGIRIDGYNDIKTGDVMEIYEIKEEAATLDI